MILGRGAAVGLNPQEGRKSFRKRSVCLWKCNRVRALPSYSSFLSSVLSARNLLRNVATSLCAVQFSRLLTHLPSFSTSLFFLPSDFGQEIRFLMHIRRELNVTRDVFQQIDPLAMLLPSDFGAKHPSPSFDMRVYVQGKSWPVGGLARNKVGCWTWSRFSVCLLKLPVLD